MTPDRLAANGSEHAHQSALFCWLNMASSYGFTAADDSLAYEKDAKEYCDKKYKGEAIPCLKFVFAIPNGGLRNKATAARLKAEGVKAGVPDTFFPLQSLTYNGLWIEMKVGGNITSKEQETWHEFLRRQDFMVAVCYSWREASSVIKIYYLSSV